MSTMASLSSLAGSPLREDKLRGVYLLLRVNSSNSDTWRTISTMGQVNGLLSYPRRGVIEGVSPPVGFTPVEHPQPHLLAENLDGG